MSVRQALERSADVISRLLESMTSKGREYKPCAFDTLMTLLKRFSLEDQLLPEAIFVDLERARNNLFPTASTQPLERLAVADCLPELLMIEPQAVSAFCTVICLTKEALAHAAEMRDDEKRTRSVRNIVGMGALYLFHRTTWVPALKHYITTVCNTIRTYFREDTVAQTHGEAIKCMLHAAMNQTSAAAFSCIMPVACGNDASARLADLAIMAASAGNEACSFLRAYIKSTEPWLMPALAEELVKNVNVHGKTFITLPSSWVDDPHVTPELVSSAILEIKDMSDYGLHTLLTQLSSLNPTLAEDK